MKKIILRYLVAFIMGAGATIFFRKDLVKIEERIVTRDIIRTVVKERIVKNKDGSETIIRETTKNEDRKKKQARVESRPAKPKWGIGVKYDLFQVKPVYTVEVQRRIVWDLYVGVYGRTDGVAGIGITYLF